MLGQIQQLEQLGQLHSGEHQGHRQLHQGRPDGHHGFLDRHAYLIGHFVPGNAQAKTLGGVLLEKCVGTHRRLHLGHVKLRDFRFRLLPHQACPPGRHIPAVLGHSLAADQI